MAVHVPAWKKLGLTLKHQASPSSHDTTHIQPNASPNKERKLVEKPESGLLDATRDSRSHINGSHLPQGQTREKPAPRRPQTSTDLNGSDAQQKRELKTPRRHDSIATGKPVPPQGPNQEGTEPLPVVSAAAAPKSKDKSKSGGNANSKKRSNNNISDDVDLAERRRIKRQKREARRNSNHEGTTEAMPSQPSTSTADPSLNAGPYLAYLDAFHNDKENWKFNKNQQNSILKYAFDVARIPPSHDHALLAYLKGLQGHAARDRVATTARKILAEPLPQDPTSSNEAAMASTNSNINTNETNETNDTTKDKARDSASKDDQALEKSRTSAKKRDTRILKSALKRKVPPIDEQSREFHAKMRQRQRAAAILAHLMTYKLQNTNSIVEQGIEEDEIHRKNENRGGDVDANGEAVNVNANGKAGKRVRARKRRTGVPDDDTSSSASSSSLSESSDSSDSSDSEASPAVSRNASENTQEMKTVEANDDESESESSSDSISDSDSSNSSDAEDNSDEDSSSSEEEGEEND